MDFMMSGGASIAGDVLGAGVGILQQNAQNKFNAREAEKNRVFQSDEAQKARDFDLEMWNKNNEYNDPSAQYERLKNLGFSDANVMSMMSGSGAAAGNASQVQSSAMASGSQASAAPNVDSLARFISDIPKDVINMENAKQDNIMKRIENRMKEFDASKQEEQYMIQLEQQHDVLEQMKNDIEAGKLDNDMRRKGLEKADMELGILINDLAMSNMDKEAHQQFLDLSLRIQAAEAELNETRSKFEQSRIIAEIEQMKASAANMYAQAALAGAEKEGVNLQNMMTEFDSRHQGDRYNREVEEYNQRMKNYRTERTMSVVNGTVGAITNVAGAVAQFLPTNIVTNTVGHMFGHYNDYKTVNKNYKSFK